MAIRRIMMPEFITALHEESAVTMAHGYAKAEGKPMLALLHGTIGIQHAAMSIYQAYYDRVPVLMIAGNDPDFIPAHTAHDMAGMVRSYHEMGRASRRRWTKLSWPFSAPTTKPLRRRWRRLWWCWAPRSKRRTLRTRRVPAYKPPQFPTIDATRAQRDRERSGGLRKIPGSRWGVCERRKA